MRIDAKQIYLPKIWCCGSLAAFLGGIIATGDRARRHRIPPTIDVTSSRLIPDIVGASTTVITAVNRAFAR